MDKEDLPSDSDESDVDYNPSGEDSNLPSEVDSDGDDEEPLAAEGDDEKGKRKRKQKGGKKKMKTVSKIEEEIEEENEGQKALSAEEEKKITDSLWSDFLSDTKSKPSTPASKESTKTKETSKIIETPKVPVKPEEKKVVVTKIFEFAGEEVHVTKEVPADSIEARLQTTAKPTATSSRGRGRAQPGSLKGMSAILGQLGKKEKLGTLDKSKLDWDRFKRSEGIEDELQTHNRGKEGYLEKQDFLQRADVRQFEIEKDMRTTTRRSNR